MNTILAPYFETGNVASGMQLDPAVLLASAIDSDGNLRLPDPEGGALRICLDGEGGMRQRREGREEPLDHRLLAAAVRQVFGSITPAEFQASDGGEIGDGPDASDQRIRLLQRAFCVYLVLYEDRLM